MAQNYDEILARLTNFQSQELSIIRLSEAISAAQQPTDHSKRTSSTSTDSLENHSPAALAADLTHYKVFISKSSLCDAPQFTNPSQELFSKLRFSYLEQVTKEKFLRAIVGDPPQTVEHHENIELDAKLVDVKADLKVQKEEVAVLVQELEAKGRALSRRSSRTILPKSRFPFQANSGTLNQATNPSPSRHPNSPPSPLKSPPSNPPSPISALNSRPHRPRIHLSRYPCPQRSTSLIHADQKSLK